MKDLRHSQCYIIVRISKVDCVINISYKYKSCENNYKESYAPINVKLIV
jgi:hypothetical protein